jgi:hypothetical protein
MIANTTERWPTPNNSYEQVKSKNGRLETGSVTCFAPIIGRNETSNANTLFSWVTDTTERRAILNNCCGG